MSDTVETKKKGNGAYLATIIILLLGLAFMAYLWSSKNSALNEAMNENAKLRSDMKGMNEMLSGYVGTISNDLTKDFKNMLSTYDALLEKDASKADSINAQKEEIQDLLDQVKRGKMTAHQLFKAKEEIETLRAIMRGYVYQIDSLNTQLYQTRSDLDSTSNLLTSTTAERDQYKEEAEYNAAQVKKGSKLHAYSFATEGLKERLNSTKTPTTKARNVVQIRSTFTIGKNPITESGMKTVYMQVIDPSGKVMQTSAGNIVTTESGDIAYSDRKNIEYKNESVDMTIYYSLRGQKASKGNYKVNIYCQGQLIGSDSFTLK
jgi:hypothetical protein